MDPYELWNRIISVNLVEIELLKAHGYTTGTASSVRSEFLSQFSNWVGMQPFCRPLGILRTSREIACSLTVHFDLVYCGCRADTGPVTWLRGDGRWTSIMFTRSTSLRFSNFFLSLFFLFSFLCPFLFYYLFLPFFAFFYFFYLSPRLLLSVLNWDQISFWYVLQNENQNWCVKSNEMYCVDYR